MSSDNEAMSRIVKRLMEPYVESATELRLVWKDVARERAGDLLSSRYAGIASSRSRADLRMNN